MKIIHSLKCFINLKDKHLRFKKVWILNIFEQKIFDTKFFKNEWIYEYIFIQSLEIKTQVKIILTYSYLSSGKSFKLVTWWFEGKTSSAQGSWCLRFNKDEKHLKDSKFECLLPGKQIIQVFDKFRTCQIKF